MNRNLKLFCIGTLPLWVGVVINSVLTLFPIPIFIFSVIYLLLWTYLCYRACSARENAFTQTLILCLFGFVMLALVTWQELWGAYWISYLGLATQLYFLPALSAAVFLLNPFTEVLSAFPAYVVEMAMMALLCLLACLLKTRKKKQA